MSFIENALPLDRCERTSSITRLYVPSVTAVALSGLNFLETATEEIRHKLLRWIVTAVSPVSVIIN